MTWGMPDYLAEENRRVGQTEPRDHGMTPEDVEFWNLILDNYSGEFLEGIHMIAEEAFDRRENDDEGIFNKVVE